MMLSMNMVWPLWTLRVNSTRMLLHGKQPVVLPLMVLQYQMVLIDFVLQKVLSIAFAIMEVMQTKNIGVLMAQL